MTVFSGGLKFRLPILLACCLLAPGCDSRLIELSRDMRDTRGNLKVLTGAESAIVKVVNDETLAIDLGNPPANAAPAAERRTLARRAAQTAVDGYSLRENLETVTVRYIEYRKKYLFLTVSRETDRYEFALEKGKLRLRRDGSDGE